VSRDVLVVSLARSSVSFSSRRSRPLSFVLSAVVLHLSEAERTDEPTVDREELIEWYLEQKEADLQNIEDLEAERELIGKALNKLVKVRSKNPPLLLSSPSFRDRTDADAGFISRVSHRINTFSKSEERRGTLCLRLLRTEEETWTRELLLLREEEEIRTRFRTSFILRLIVSSTSFYSILFSRL